MGVVENLSVGILSRLPAETAHLLSLQAMRRGLFPRPTLYQSPRLQTKIGLIPLPNPVGLAAGYDKNAVAVRQLLDCGFGFVEMGTVTPKPQFGNSRPRIFRLHEDRGVINRIGFANDGAHIVARNLEQRRPGTGVVGINLGANRHSVDRIGDYCRLYEKFGKIADYVTLNVSSPNTENLRDLQGKSRLADLLTQIRNLSGNANGIPVFLKISPDLTDDDICDIAEVAVEAGVDALVATNSTVMRQGLRSKKKSETGGLSGRPLFEHSTRILAKFHSRLHGTIPLIGVGGVGSAQDAYEKICAGACAIQLYTALPFEGLSLIPRILEGLDSILEQNGFNCILDAVGTSTGKWLQ